MIPFVKMHGIGNDYVLIDAVSDPAIESRHDLPALARAMSDRHRGIGSDGIILVCPPARDGHVRMRMFNADGSEAEMCGNGVRCVAKLAHERLGIRRSPLRVEAGRGELAIEPRVVQGRLVEATVDMGAPILDPARIPVDVRALEWFVPETGCGGFEVASRIVVAAFVSMGNPHAVLFADENPWLGPGGIAGLDLVRLGPEVERHPAFPARINVHVVEVQRPSHAAMRTWERGAGETLACGTGACAVCVAGVRTGRLDRSVTLRLPGGDLAIRWDAPGAPVLMRGPASEVFEGHWDVDDPAAR
jgi:diaminopimelate epimerase